MRDGRLALAIVLAFASPIGAAAQEADSGEAATIRYEFKSTGLFTHGPDNSEIPVDSNTATGFWRFRVVPTARFGRWTFEGAVEPRASVFTDAGAFAGALFVGEAPAPWRLVQADWRVGSGDHANWHVEVDRVAAHAQFGGAEITVGRQGIGWGRGLLFGAVDLFSPFSPLDPDREWRRGVDAARADIRLSDRSSLDVVGAYDAERESSIFAGRLRGYAGKMDLELVAGRRALDLFAGVTSSVAGGGAELHGEAAAFKLPDTASPLLAPTVVKAVAGGSWRIPVGNGLLMFAEYHYSGFGAPTAAEITTYLADPDVRDRYARGDMQILFRHAIAVLGTYEQSPETSWSLQWLQSPVDGSGVVMPSATLTFSDRTSLIISGYVPYGREPAGITLQSDFGATPLGLYLQLRIYR